MPNAPPKPTEIRFTVEPRDVPASKAGRRLHLTLADFELMLPALLGRGFPPPDPTTGMFDLAAIDQWMSSRHNLPLAPGLTAEPRPRDAAEVFTERRASRGTR